MTTITGQVTNTQTYDPTLLPQSIENAATAATTDNTVVDPSLLSALSQSSATASTASTSAETPTLAEPTMAPTASNYYVCSGLPSPGAAMMATMVENTAEERRDNAEVRIAQTDVIVTQMENQADEMRSNAAKQLAMGIVSGVLNIASAAVNFAMTANTMKQTSGLDLTNEADRTAFQGLSMKQQGFSSALSDGMSGLTGMIDAGADYADTLSQARIKEMDADIEQQQAFRDILQSLDEALSQQISKALSTMEAIQSDMNQTRTRIVG
ncbi:MAG: type III secretion system translocon subunit SctB [Pseudomonadota bacterium]